jgi:hypothetical protein
MLFPANTTDGRTVNIVKKEYVANEGIFLTDEEGNEYVVAENGQRIAPVAEATAEAAEAAVEEASAQADPENDEQTGNADEGQEPSGDEMEEADSQV